MQHIDYECFEALKRNENEARSKTYIHYRSFAFYVAKRCNVPTDTAEDVVQMAFIKLYENAYKLESPTSVAQWLAVTLRNLCFDEFRKRTRHSKSMTDYRQHEEMAQTQSQSIPDSALFEGQIYEQAIQIVGASSGGQTLKDFYLKGMSAQEIATQNKEAIGTVTARLSRLRKKLKDTLLSTIKSQQEMES
ncbi:MAG: hypothetical protein RJB13_1228 [Pseudomonadota bacterium]|jgi:RNA polymerase sigma-70 factor (ECF subfamily)